MAKFGDWKESFGEREFEEQEFGEKEGGKRNAPERTGLWTLSRTLDQEKNCHISAAGRRACVPHATGGSPEQCLEI